MVETATRIALIGIGATALIDGWAFLLKRLSGAPSLDYRLVGRWVGHMPQGQLMHARIAAAPAVPGEQALGWATHYVSGVVFAAVLVAAVGAEWLTKPTPEPAMIFGLATVAVPFVVMQPALGMGVAASKSPNPALARLRSVTTHLVFGLGLYLSAALAAAVAS